MSVTVYIYIYIYITLSWVISSVVFFLLNFNAFRYITYSKEEEAIRCIQNVHGFILDGRPLR
jgi:CCR4-NOT transcription complex subunit 4